MKQESSRKFVTIEEHSLILDESDLTRAIEAADADAVGNEELELQPILLVDGKAISPDNLLTMLRSMNPNIPEGAKFALAITWQEQVEFDPSQMMAPQAPQQTRQQMQQMAPQGAPYHQQQQFTPQYAQQMQQQYAPAPPQFQQQPFQQPNPQQCRTCAAVPDLHGPMPDCMDAMGCGRVLREKGQLLPPRTVLPPGAPSLGMGPAPGVLINRETGAQAFADKNGMPYGVHSDYSNR